MDLATTIMAMSAASTRSSIAMSAIRQNNKMLHQVVEKLLQPASAPLPDGQGTQVDKTA